MAVQTSSLPKNLPPQNHLHLANFILPDKSITDFMGVHKLLREITGEFNPPVTEEYGQRMQYRHFYTLRNAEGAVQITVYAGGSGQFKDTVAVGVNGLCFETWSSHNPLTIDPINLIRFVFDRGGWFTRLDLARNDYRRIIDWKELLHCSDKNHFRDRITTRLCRIKPPLYLRKESESVYFGESKSRTQILIYNKADREVTKFPWIRAEMKIRGKQQCNHVASLLLEGMNIDRLIGGLLSNYLSFVEASPDAEKLSQGYLDYYIATDSELAKNQYEKRNRPVLKWWTDFVGTEKIKLTPPKPAKATQDIEDAFYEISF